MFEESSSREFQSKARLAIRSPVRARLMNSMFAVFLFASCDGGGGGSDVPYIVADEWIEDVYFLLARFEDNTRQAILVTGKTIDQIESDGFPDNGGTHSAVYRYDVSDRTFGLTESESWERSDDPILRCEVGSERIVGLPGDSFRIWGGYLEHNEERVDVYGGAYIEAHWVRGRDLVAVVSSDGTNPWGGGFGPRIAGSGQLYLQALSGSNAIPVSQPIRLPFTQVTFGPYMCGLGSDDYLVYFTLKPGQTNGPSIVAIVPITDLLPR